MKFSSRILIITCAVFAAAVALSFAFQTGSGPGCRPEKGREHRSGRCG